MNRNYEPDRLRERLASNASVTDITITRIDWGRRVIPPSRSTHVRGWHPVRPGHTVVPFESLLESRLISRLASCVELIRIRSQPVTIEYRHGGRLTKYTPDLLVEFESVPEGLKQLGFEEETFVEVKPLVRSLKVEHVLNRQFLALRAALARPITLVTDWDISLALREVSHAA
jgi:hypothetical protein